MHNYIKIDAVLNFIAKSVRKEEDDLSLKQYAFQAFRLLKLPSQTVNDIQIICVEDHKAKMPEGMRYLNLLTYMTEMPTLEQEEDLLCAADEDYTACVRTQEECESYTDSNGDFIDRTLNKCRISLYEELWIKSNYYKHCFKPLKYVGHTKDLSKHFICNGCPNIFQAEGDDSFSINPITRQFITTMKDGFLCVNFQTIPKDEDGNILIPDDAKLLRGLAMYAQAMSLENRALMHEENMANMADRFLVKAERMLKSYKGSTILENINLRNLQKIIGTDTHAQNIMRYGTQKFTDQPDQRFY